MVKTSRYRVEGKKVFNDNNEVVFTEDLEKKKIYRETAEMHKGRLDYQESLIDITGVDLKKFIKEVYNLSSPQGMGYLHARDGELSDDDANSIIERGDDRIAVSMDYVHGRACKMTVVKKDEKLTIPPTWYDHHISYLIELLKRCGVDHDIETEGDLK